ncbi:hypothetical protein D3C87_178300 [compost metagenome]
MKHLKVTLSVIFFLSTLFSYGQHNFKGLILDAKDNKPITKANVSDGFKTVLSDSSGLFSISLLKNLTLKVSSIGYLPLNYSFTSKKMFDTLYLNPKDEQLLQVEIATKKSKLNNTLASSNYFLFKGADLSRIPSLFGNSDILSALKTLPGIGKGGEGNGGLYVRGGSSGQNMVLFNDAVIYQPTHLLGIFSVFSSYFVDNVKLYKSGLPSYYRGRLSSVIDITSNTKIADSLNGNASIGMISADTSIDIPLSNNWSVTVGGRTSFMNLFLWPIHNKTEKGSQIGYDFYDINLNSSFRSGKNKFFLSAYHGKDIFDIDITSAVLTNKMKWSNNALSLSWTRPIDTNVVLRSTLVHSGYNFDFNISQENSQIGVLSSIRDLKISNFLTFFLSKQTINLGVEFSSQQIKPNIPSLINQDFAFDFGPDKTFYVNDFAIFANNDIFFEKITVTPGVRLNFSSVKNKRGNESSFSSFWLLEPSLLVKYNFNRDLSLRVTANKNYQTMHLLPISSSSFPSDFWIPSFNQIKPQYVYQLSVGLFKDWTNFEAYLDFFHKNMQRVIEFNGGIGSLIDNLNIEENVITGKGKVIGVEFYIKKRTGRLQTTFAYTLSKSTRIFPEINRGKQFPFRFDRPHDINITSSFHLNKKWAFSLLFTYASGNTYTAPIGRYIIEDNVVNEYGLFNAARMPDYHRLDFSVAYMFSHKKALKSELILSVYNVYNRANPIFAYYDYKGNLSTSVIISQKQLALLPIFPSLTYKIKF